MTLGATLEAVQRQELPETFEVIVVDDGSVDGTAAVVREYEGVRLIRLETSQGPGRARNRGVAEARGSTLAFTDADCVPTARWLAAGLAAIREADLVQGRVDPDPKTRRTPFDRTLAVEDHGGFYQTANLFVRRTTFECVGGFRDWALEKPGRRRWSVDRRRRRATRTPIGEDTLFAWTARRTGARSVFAADAVVHHVVVPGGLRDDLEDHWHWARDMSGLARLVPELRKGAFFRRWWFNRWTAQFDLAIAAVAMAAICRRPAWLLGVAPYARRLAVESRRYPKREAIAFLLGSPMVELATLAGLLRGSIESGSVVL